MESRRYAAYLATLGSAKFRALWPNQGHVLAAADVRTLELLLRRAK